MNNPSETNSAQRQHEARRRNLLRLGAAAPMVLTLRPGASFAAVSMNCIQKGMNGADEARAAGAEKLTTSPDADEWVRAQVDILELRKIDFAAKSPQDTLIEGKYVLGTDGSTFWRVDSGSPGVGPMVASAKSTPRVSFGNDAIGKDASFSGDWNTTNAQGTPIEKRWALIKVDRTTGEPLGYSWEPKAENGTAVSDACMASVNGLARYTGTWDGIGAYVKRALGLS